MISKSRDANGLQVNRYGVQGKMHVSILMLDKEKEQQKTLHSPHCG